MKTILSFVFLCFLFNACNRSHTPEISSLDPQLIKQISDQQKYALNLINQVNKNDRYRFPRSLNEDGSIHLVNKRDWTSGFYPGVLWLMYDLTDEEAWKNEAFKFTTLLESEQFNDSNHDIGFKMMSSYGQGYRLTDNKKFSKILVQSAHTLVTRFNDKVGCIRSWDHHKDKWDYPVIIDNMINLELLFWASKETGDPVFANIAVKHAETTLKNHFRPDYSSYHVVSYDTITGEVAQKQTRQGYAHESSWARGQAWALYGYTMTYRETKDQQFLDQAENIASFLFNKAVLPEDLVPYWDFDAPNIPDEPRDASAAAVIASALYELSNYSKIKGDFYLQKANKIMDSLSSEKYFNAYAENQGFLLRHSTGSLPIGSEIDVPLIYADYYFLEALTRKYQYEIKTSN